MEAFPLPVNLVENTRQFPAPGRPEWLAALPDTVRGLAQRWSLRLGAPYQPGWPPTPPGSPGGWPTCSASTPTG